MTASASADAVDSVSFSNPRFPAVDLSKEGHLNAYLYDFYRHAQLSALVLQNRIPETELWNQLEDFNMVLKAGSLPRTFCISVRRRALSTAGPGYVERV